MRAIFATLILALMPAAASAGAWPREVGTSFLSFSYTVSDDRAVPGVDPQAYSALFFEIGVAPRLAFGIDAGIGQNGDYSAIVFARRPMDWSVLGGVTSVKIGLGLTETGGASDTLLQLGGSWGRGLDTRFGAGWIGLDTQMHYRTEAGDVVGKADLTLGIKPNDRTMLIVQLQASRYPGSDPALSLAPSVVRRFGDAYHVELGLDLGLINDDSAGIKLGTWLDF